MKSSLFLFALASTSALIACAGTAEQKSESVPNAQPTATSSDSSVPAIPSDTAKAAKKASYPAT